MDPVVDSLAAYATPPPWLVAAGDGNRVADALRRLVPELSDGLRACEVDDLRLKGDRWIGRYLVTAAHPGGVVQQATLTGVLMADGAPLDEQGTDVPFASQGWEVALPDPPLLLSTAAPDRKLTALPLLIDPVSARVWLENALSGAFPGIRVASCEPVVARYRPGQRCTVVCQLSYDAAADPS